MEQTNNLKSSDAIAPSEAIKQHTDVLNKISEVVGDASEFIPVDEHYEKAIMSKEQKLSDTPITSDAISEDSYVIDYTTNGDESDVIDSSSCISYSSGDEIETTMSFERRSSADEKMRLRREQDLTDAVSTSGVINEDGDNFEITVSLSTNKDTRYGVVGTDDVQSTIAFEQRPMSDENYRGVSTQRSGHHTTVKAPPANVIDSEATHSAINTGSSYDLKYCKCGHHSNPPSNYLYHPPMDPPPSYSDCINDKSETVIIELPTLLSPQYNAEANQLKIQVDLPEPPVRGSSFRGVPPRGSYHGEVHLDFDGPRVTKDHKKHEDTLLGPSGIHAGEDEDAIDEDDPWALSDITEMGKSWKEMSNFERFKRVTIDWFLKPVLIILLLYLFICSLDLMSSAFRLLGGKEAGEVFKDNALLQNPICGLMIGILATVLVQSSSTSTSIVVSVVGAGILPVPPSIFIIMGANIGTSVTNTIVSLAQSGNRNEFRRAFGGATIHDMFNWLSVFVLLPLEAATSYLYHISKAIVDGFHIQTNEEANVELLKKLTKPFSKKIVQIDSKMIRKIATGHVDASEAKLLKVWCEKDKIPVVVNASYTPVGAWTTAAPVTEIKEVGTEKCSYLFANTGLSERAVGAILLVIALIMLCACLIGMVKLLNSLLKGRMAVIIKKTINAEFPGPIRHLTGYFAILIGAGITFLVQSSSVFTSALTPLVGVGVVTLERMFPLTLGSNIGTTATGLLAAMASSGDKLTNSLQIAICHLFFNISGILIWYPIPIMRKLPIYLAKCLGNTTAEYRWFAIFYLIMMFFFLPLVVFGLSVISIWALAGVGIPLVILFIFVVIVNVLQRKRPQSLPEKLKNWEFLPEPFRSLDPLDRLISKARDEVRGCCSCCRRNDEKMPMKEKGTLPMYNGNNANPNQGLSAVHFNASKETATAMSTSHNMQHANGGPLYSNHAVAL